nr:RGS1-HXK1-interacting protein 1 [Ipomoea batatas]
MAIIAESSDENSKAPPPSVAPPLPQQRGNYSDNLETLAQAAPWIDDALQQARQAQQTIETGIESAIAVTKSRLDRILTTSSAHFNQTLDSLQDVKAEYHVYEDLTFGKIKEGISIAASHPLITIGAFLSLGFLGLKRPRRFLYYKARSIFISEEAMLSKADAKVKELKKSIDFLKAESEKWEKNAVQAEQELIRGKTKLRQAGKQIRSVIRSAYKIERQAAGLKDVLKELPRREASLFRSQVSNLASEAKKERNFLTKEVTKISNHGISV